MQPTRNLERVIARGRWWIPPAMAVTGVVLTVSAFLGWRNQERSSILMSHQLRAGERIEAIEGRLQRPQSRMGGLLQFFQASETIQWARFQTFAARFDRDPVAEVVLWAPRVAHGQRQDHEQKPLRTTDYLARSPPDITDYAIREPMLVDGGFEPVPASRRAEYYPARHVSPWPRNRHWWGVDMGAIPQVRQAIHQARQSGELAISAPLEGPGVDEDFSTGEAVVWVVIHVQRPARAQADAFDGIVAARFRVETLIGPALPEYWRQRIRLEMWDGGELFFISNPELAFDPEVVHSSTIAIGQRQWELRVYPALSAMAAEQSRGPEAILIGGLLITGLLVAYLSTLTRRAAYVEKQVDQRTAELRRLHEALELRAQRMGQLVDALSRAEQSERSRIARVLHDHLQQMLVAAVMRLDMLHRHVPDAQQQSLATVRQWLGEVIDLTRTLTVELNPPVLEHAGLSAALHWLADWMSQKHGLTVALHSDPGAEPQQQSLQRLLFHTARELLFNVVKHAKVDQAELTLRTEGDRLIMQISDRGAGFGVAQAMARPAATGFGLASMRQRIAMIGGEIRIDSAPGRGTTIRIEVPASAMRQAA
jgi:signal transduction histidine kinase